MINLIVMRTLKDLVIVFFVGLGIHRVLQDVLSSIDPELVTIKDDGYFSVIAFMVLYFSLRYLKTKDEETTKETKTTN
jgi:hypothetical protein